MKQLLLIALAATLAACGKENVNSDTPTCEMQADVEMVEYPTQGIPGPLKSEVEVCTHPSGKVCVYYSYISNPKINKVICR